MKYIWEEIDVEVGRQIESHNRAEKYVIGYDPNPRSTSSALVLVSLSDGMIVAKDKNKNEMVSFLNADGVGHAYRPTDIRQDRSKLERGG